MRFQEDKEMNDKFQEINDECYVIEMAKNLN